jgi:hypothetical protein
MAPCDIPEEEEEEEEVQRVSAGKIMVKFFRDEEGLIMNFEPRGNNRELRPLY